MSELIQIKTAPSKDDFLKKHVEQRSKRQLTLQSQFKKDKIDAFVKVAHCVAPKTENVDEIIQTKLYEAAKKYSNASTTYEAFSSGKIADAAQGGHCLLGAHPFC